MLLKTTDPDMREEVVCFTETKSLLSVIISTCIFASFEELEEIPSSAYTQSSELWHLFWFHSLNTQVSFQSLIWTPLGFSATR